MVHWSKKSGGEKHMELQNNREFILECLDQFGLDETCRLFNITKLETLQALIRTDMKPRKLSKVDQAELRSRIAIAGYETVNKRLADIQVSQEKKKRFVIEPFNGYLVKEMDIE